MHSGPVVITTLYWDPFSTLPFLLSKKNKNFFAQHWQWKGILFYHEQSNICFHLQHGLQETMFIADFKGNDEKQYRLPKSVLE